ncbi:hypothetical protein M513_01784, partial [Trichuris suis]
MQPLYTKQTTVHSNQANDVHCEFGRLARNGPIWSEGLSSKVQERCPNEFGEETLKANICKHHSHNTTER